MINFMHLEAVIWDMDGVMLDSGSSHYKALHAILEKYKIKIYEERLQRAFGMTNQQVIQFIVDQPISEELIDRISREKDALFQQIIREQAVFLPGVKKWIETFRQNGIRQALASSGSPGNINAVLTALAAETYFDEIVSGDGKPSKPDPYIFLKAADCLRVIPLNCLVIEDAVAGVQAAKAAGMKCVAVTTTNSAEKLAHADIVLNNLAELMTGHIQSLFFDQ
ncbi:MAG: HAD family phosphatase [Anaerolineaceae bacterium]|nr:HAD family phosphatase [Anaerolineaceae bacterium]